MTTTTMNWWRGARLARARRRRALTQTALARRINGHQMTISRLERGVSQPSLRMLLRLTKALGVPLTDLLPR
jgi:transcriptional regulator with XRE-family HTH domain